MYQDALEFMDKELTVADICQYLSTKKLGEQQSIELLSFMIESSDDFETRIHAIQAFRVLKLNSDQVFLILESSLLSDEKREVRDAAAKVLSRIFPEKSKNLLLNYFRNPNSK